MNHCLNDTVISSPMLTPEAYFSPNQIKTEMTQKPAECWYQQQQQHGISCSSRQESDSPCSITLVNSSAPSCSAQYMPLIDPMVFGNNNSGGATTVTSTVSSQHQSAYQQPMMMPLLQHETQEHDEKLLSPCDNYESMMVSNPYISYSLQSPMCPNLSNMYSLNNQFGMPTSNNNNNNSGCVSYRVVCNNNYASTFDHSSMHPLHNNQQQYPRYPQTTQHEIKHNSHHHLMTTTGNAYVSSSSSPLSSSSSSTSPSPSPSPPTSSCYIQNNNNANPRHKQNNNNNNSHNSFPCLIPECNKLFSRPYNLKSHMRTHTHERPYECSYKPCAWKFARPHDLKRHELQHTGQKPHGCRFCHRRFARSDALKRHWKVDIHCAQALKQETAQNGGTQVQMRRKKSSKQ